MSAGSFVRREWALVLDVGTAVLFLLFGAEWLGDLSNPSWFLLMLAWLLSVILISAFAVVRHAESLAVRLGEPLGTLILTLSVTGVEVMMIAAVMFAGTGGSAMARDAMFAVVMIVLNGMVGLSLVLGGLRHHEQTYNLQGANAFLAVIVPLAVLGLVLPTVSQASPGPTLSSTQAQFLIVMSTGLYAVFLVIQNQRHKNYFIAPGAEQRPGDAQRTVVAQRAGDIQHAAVEQSTVVAQHTNDAKHPAIVAAAVRGHTGLEIHSVRYHATFLAAYLVPLVLLAKQLGKPIQHGIEVWHAPPALGGLIVAALVLLPESMGAARAAVANDLQRSVNILLGSVLATISMTIPSVLTIGLVTHRTITLGLDAVDSTMLILTLAVAMITFSSARTNVLSGAVHVLLFLAYLMLIFEK